MKKIILVLMFLFGVLTPSPDPILQRTADDKTNITVLDYEDDDIPEFTNF
jgi:hypothetical protein